MQRFSQLWVCRQAQKTRCKGKFRLVVNDLVDFMADATATQLVDHNHAPYLTDVDAMVGTNEDTGGDSSNTDEASASNTHAISQIGEGDFSVDFERSDLDGRARSSPVAAARNDWTDVADMSTPASTTDSSWHLISQEAADGFQAVKHIKRQKNRQQPPEELLERSFTS